MPVRKKKSPPPIVYFLLFFLVGGIFWFWRNYPSAISTAGVEGRISSGDKILVTALATSQKKAGVQAQASGDYQTARAQFEASLSQYRNDPETLIYLNNAIIGQRQAYTIAVVVPISNLNVAQEILRGVAQAQNELNSRGGINGVLLRAIVANDDNDPDIARDIAAELVKNPQILAVIGHNASTASLAAAPVYQKGGLVMMTPTSTAVELTSVGDYIFRAMPSIRFVSDALAHHIVKHDRKLKLAICFDSKAPDNRSLRDAFISAILTEGAKVVNTVCDLSAPDFNPETKVSQALADGAEGLLLSPHIDRFDPVIAVARANKGRLTLYSTSTMYTSKTLQMGQADVNGLVLAVPWHPQANSTNLFVENASLLWGGVINWRTAISYDATQAIIAALQQSDTREGLQKALRTPGFTAKGAGDVIQFLPSGDRLGAIILVQVQPGGTFGYEFVPLRR